MGEQREFENKLFVESGRLRTRSLEESFQLVSSFSYGTHLSTRQKSSKSLKDSPQASQVSGTLIQNIPKRVSDRHQFNGQNNKLPVNNDNLADWLLEGRKVQESPTSSKNHRRTYSWHELGPHPKVNDRVFKGSTTYPPTSTIFSRAPHVNNIYDEERSVFLPSFNPRRLGEPVCSYKDWQRSRQKINYGKINHLDDVSEVQKQVHFRQRSSPSCLNRRLSNTELRKESSTFRPTYSRSRSASLPIPTKYDCRVDWEERKNMGVTYITPFLKNSFSK